MSVTTGQAVTLLENVLFESSTIAAANAPTWVATSHIVGEDSVATLATAMADSPEGQIAQQVVRYYMGALGRIPSGSEIQFYINVAEKGLSAAALASGTSAVPGTIWTTIASYFEASPEFSADYGLPNGAALAPANEALVITAFYSNVLGRAPSSSDLAFYENAISQGTTVPQLLQYFTSSPEYQNTVDTGISTALASYGAAVVNGDPPATIPYVVPGQILTETLGASALTVAGVSRTTTVTVTGTPAQAAQSAVNAVTGVVAVSPVAAATGVQGVAAVAGVTPQAAQTAQSAVTDGAVTINDANFSASGAGSITSVTLIDSGAGSVINDNALTTLALTGTTGTLAITNLNSAAIAAHSATLALTLDGLNVPANGITDTNSEISTLNVTTANHDSTLAGFADTNLTSLSVSGTNKLTLTSINASLTSLTISGAAGFSDGASVHGTGLAARGSQLTIADSSTGSFTAVLDDTTQSFTGTAGTDTITVSASADATKTIAAGSATNNEIIFEGGAYALTSASSGKFVNFQTVGVAGNVSGTIDLSVIDASASQLDVRGASNVAFIKAATGAALLLDASPGASVSLTYADSTGASDSASVTMSSAVNSLTVQDAAGVGVATVNITNNLAGSENDVSAAHSLSNLADNGLSTLNVSGSAGLTINSLTESSTPATGFTLNNSDTDFYGVTIATLGDTALTSLTFAGSGSSAIGSLAVGGASFTVANSGATLESIGTLTDNSLTSLSLAANVALGQAATASASNGLQDASTAGVTVSGSADNAHVTVNLTSGAASGKTDSITLGNGNNVVIDASSAGTVNLTLGSGANLVELGTGSLDTTAHYAVTLSTRTATPPNAIFVGAAGATYASAPNAVITGATSGDIIAFGNDSLSSSALLAATSLSGASSVATALGLLEAAATTAHKVVYGVYGGNTYIVESTTGIVGTTDTAVIEVTGSQVLTASTGYVTLGSTASVLSAGSALSGAGFTIPAGTATNLTLGIGGNVVTLVGSTAGVVDNFTSAASSGTLSVNYQATSASTGIDTLQMSGTGGSNRSDVTGLTVNDTSSGGAGVTMGAFSDNGLASVTYNNSTVSASAVTQQTLTSTSLNSINFSGGTSGVANNYFFTGTLSTSGTLSINDSNSGSGTAAMGLNLSGGPSTLSLTMTGPGTLATGTLSDNNLTTLTIAGNSGVVTVGTLTDTNTGGFTVNDTNSAISSSTIVLDGVSAVSSLTVNDSAYASLTDSSSYADPNLTTLTLENSGHGVLTIGGGGITANALSSVVIGGSNGASIVTGTLSIGGSGTLTITDNSTAVPTTSTTLPLDGVTGITALTVNDSATNALNLGNLVDNALTSLSLAASGSSTLTLGTVTVNALSTFNFARGGTAAIVTGNITDGVAGPLTVNDNSTSTSATTLTFASVPNATSFTVNDNDKGALTIASLTDNQAASVTFQNTSSALLSATVSDSAATVALNLTGSGTGSDAIGLTDAAGAGSTALTIVDSSTSSGANTVTPTLTGGPATLTVSDSAAGALAITAVADDTLASATLTNTSNALLSVASITSAANGTLASLTFAGSGTISVPIVSVAADSAATLTLSDGDTGSATLGTLTLGGAVGSTNSLVVHNSNSGSGNLSLSTGTTGIIYATNITLDNTSAGTSTISLTDGATSAATVTLSGSGTQVVTLTDSAGRIALTQANATAHTNLTLTHNGVSGDSVTLGNGTNVVTLNDSFVTDTLALTLGTGTNSVALSAGHTVGSVITLSAALGSNANTAPVSADSFTNFLLDSAVPADGDTLALGFTSANILTTADINGGGSTIWTVTHGMMTSTNATLLNFISAVQTATKAAGVAGVSGIAAFSDGQNTWVAYNDHSGTNVAVVELVGVVASGIEAGAMPVANYLHIA